MNKGTTNTAIVLEEIIESLDQAIKITEEAVTNLNVNILLKQAQSALIALKLIAATLKE